METLELCVLAASRGRLAALSRLRQRFGAGAVRPVQVVSTASLKRLEHEYECRDELDASWAVRPIALPYYHARWTLMLKAQGRAS
jgi:hypothetical protein